MDARHLDVLIVGAGLSGIGAAVHLKARHPGKSFAILEARDRLGGTWDLFRYPGIRSDSDMFTLGYSFKPWTNPRAIADGPSILAYIQETADEHGITPRIELRKTVVAASWSSADARWTITVEDGATGATERLTCGFLFVCAGYYEYAHGYTPELPGRDRFRGRIVHPQQWTDDVETAGRRIVVIGSGATAVTLVPELARTAAHVTMLQRSPTYVLSRPARDRIADTLRARLPAGPAYGLTRWKNVLLGMAFYQACRRFPARAREVLVGEVRRLVGDHVDVAKHFTPTYDPWDQRVCLVPDADLFVALREGRASVVTDHVETFTETGIRLRSGRELEADLVITATGLELKFLGGITLEVDGRPVVPAKTMTYKGMMLSDVPNAAMAVGYTNASWTLKCELTIEYVCRLLAHMDRHGYRSATPRRRDPGVTEEPLIDFSSGYVRRGIDRLPRQGSVAPWKAYQNYALDLVLLRHRAVDDGSFDFAR